MRLLTLNEAKQICQELNCQDCPCSDYGNLGGLKNIQSVCYKELIENYNFEDFKEILEK